MIQGYQEVADTDSNEQLLSLAERSSVPRSRMWRGIALLAVLVIALVTLVGSSILASGDENVVTGAADTNGDQLRPIDDVNPGIGDDLLDPTFGLPGGEQECDASLRHFARPIEEYDGLNATLCADGNEYAFYYRESPTRSQNWLIVVMGMDLYCESVEACINVSEAHHHRFEAKTDPCWNGAGVFDANEPGQPFHDWNMFYLPYCSQDNWIGTGNAEAEEAGFYHKGYYLMMNFFNELQNNPEYDIVNADQMVWWWVENQVYVWGNYIGDRFTADYPNLDVRFVSDDGWYPELHTQWDDSNGASHADRLAEGWDYWGVVETNEWCVENGLTWRCLFPENSYTGFEYPIINMLNLYNRVLMFNQGEPIGGFFDGNYEVESEEHEEYLKWVVGRIVEHLSQTSCFAPACNGHTFAYAPSIMEFQVENEDMDGPVFLVDLLHDWLAGDAWDLPPALIDDWEGDNWLVESLWCDDAV